MTTVTIIVKDAGDSIEMEGRVEPAEAVDLPPTPALVVGSYLAANIEKVMKDSMQWLAEMSAKPEPGDITGAPV